MSDVVFDGDILPVGETKETPIMETVEEEIAEVKNVVKKPAKSKFNSKPKQEPLPLEVQAAMKYLDKEYGKGSVMRLGDNIEFGGLSNQISTGSISLDKAIGVFRKQKNNVIQRGLPAGRVVEVYGPEASGKTTFCNQVIASAQRSGGLCAMIDMEQAWDRNYAKNLGVMPDALLFSQPDCAEQALKTLETFIRTNAFAVIVVDSVAALVPRAEIEGSIEGNQMALQSRLMSKTLRILSPVINSSNTIVIFTNQIRSKVGVIFGSPEVTSGGNALKFYSSLRFDMRKVSVIKDANGDAIGHKCKIKVVKNKIAPPFKVAEVDIKFGEGIDRYGDLVDCATSAGVIQKKGSWYTYGDEQLGQGKENIIFILKEDENLFNEIEGKVIETLVGE